MTEAEVWEQNAPAGTKALIRILRDCGHDVICAHVSPDGDSSVTLDVERGNALETADAIESLLTKIIERCDGGDHMVELRYRPGCGDCDIEISGLLDEDLMPITWSAQDVNGAIMVSGAARDGHAFTTRYTVGVAHEAYAAFLWIGNGVRNHHVELTTAARVAEHAAT